MGRNNIFKNKKGSSRSYFEGKGNMLKSKRSSELAINKLILIILGILVLVVAVIVLTQPKIFDWIRNLPQYGAPESTEKEITPADLRLLNYEPVGKLVEERFAGLGSRWTIYYLERKSITDSECTSRGYNPKTACYDTFGFISDNKEDVDCLKYKGTYGKACFDSSGFLVYTETYIPTILYWDWNSGDSYNGDLRISEGWTRWNSKVGDIKNNFMIFDEELYNRADNKEFLVNSGFTDVMKQRLNGAKYIGGKLYKSKETALA